MERIGILSLAAPGHFYPLSSLGRRLQARGHEVVYFQVADFERQVREAGLECRQIAGEDFPLDSIRKLNEELSKLSGFAGFRCAIRRVVRSSEMILRDAPAAIQGDYTVTYAPNSTLRR